MCSYIHVAVVKHTMVYRVLRLTSINISYPNPTFEFVWAVGSLHAHVFQSFVSPVSPVSPVLINVIQVTRQC